MTVPAETCRIAFGYWLDRVAAGQNAVVTRRGKPMIRLTPVVPAAASQPYSAAVSQPDGAAALRPNGAAALQPNGAAALRPNGATALQPDSAAEAQPDTAAPPRLFLPPAAAAECA